MHKPELAAAISEIAGLDSDDAQEILSIILDEITLALSRGRTVTLIGFGSFVCKHHAARQGHHPVSGDPITIAAANTVHFRAGKKLKEKVNKIQ